MAISLLGCAKPIEDINGEQNKSLAVINEEKLMSATRGARISISKEKKSGSHSIARTDGSFEAEYDYDNVSISFKGFSGTKATTNTYLDKGKSLTITVASDIKSGNFSAVLLTPSRKIVGRFPADKEETVTVTAEEKGDYLILLAGESAEGTVTIKR